MPGILASFPSALRAAREGMSANTWLREIQSLGMGVRRTEGLQLFRIAKDAVVKAQDEPLRPTGATPTADEIGQWATKRATGFAQTVTLAYRDNTTGHISQVWWRQTYETPVTRQQAINEAIDAYSDNAENYDQTLIGAAHTSTYRYTPVAIGV
jgi:hypothetical protein